VDGDFEEIDRWRAGDAAAGEALFARHFDSLCRFFATKCRDQVDDLVQRTLLACVRAKDQFGKRSSFRTYLFTIARNELYQHLRACRRDEGRVDFSVMSIAELITTPVTRLARDAERRRVVEMLRTLPVEQQTLLELHYWEELDIAALSEVFETTAGAMRVRLHRARVALRERLGEDLPARLSHRAGSAIYQANPMAMSLPRVSTLCVFALSSGCVGEPDDLETKRQALVCPEAICGNTPHLGALPFWELDETLQQFSEVGGFRIKSLTGPLGTKLEPVVDGFWFYGRDDAGVARPVWGGAMRIESNRGGQFDVFISRGDDHPNGLHYYEDGHVPSDSPLPTYQFTYVEVTGGKRGPVSDLCREDTPTSLVRDALVFQGDRYDIINGKVLAIGAAAAPWFNIACKDDALWKLALMRHVEPAQDEFHETNQNDRTAGLRAIRADYCGTGTPKTEPGVDVDWRNRGGWLTHEADEYPQVEAIWTASGATCVDVPRFVDRNELGCERPFCPRAITAIASFFTHVPAPSP
jgi:RNA polymerase sigma-70 factor (ECF subfamily)